MAIHSVIDVEQGYVHHRVSSTLSLADIQASWRHLLRSGEFRPGMNVIWDFEADTMLGLSSDELKQVVRLLAEHMQQRGSGYRLAMVGRSDLVFGVGRMFEGLAASLPLDIRVFRNLEDAHEWLASPPAASVGIG